MKKTLSRLALVSAMSLATALGSLLVQRWGLPNFATVLLSAAIVLLFVLFTPFNTIMSLLRRSTIHDIENMHKNPYQRAKRNRKKW